MSTGLDQNNGSMGNHWGWRQTHTACEVHVHAHNSDFLSNVFLDAHNHVNADDHDDESQEDDYNDKDNDNEENVQKRSNPELK